jgi:hypothetical protein
MLSNTATSTLENCVWHLPSALAVSFLGRYLLLGAVPGVSGNAVDLGIAGTFVDDAGASAGCVAPETGDEVGAGTEAGAVAGSEPGSFPLAREDDGLTSLVSELGVSAPQPEVVRRPVRTTRSMAMRIQIEAVTTVTLVKVSPA